MPDEMFEYAKYRKAQAAAKKEMSRSTGPALIVYDDAVAAARIVRDSAMSAIEKEAAAAMAKARKERADAVDAIRRRYEGREGEEAALDAYNAEVRGAEARHSEAITAIRNRVAEARRITEEACIASLSAAKAEYDEALLVASVRYNRSLVPLKERYEKALRRIQEASPDTDAEYQGGER